MAVDGAKTVGASAVAIGSKAAEGAKSVGASAVVSSACIFEWSPLHWPPSTCFCNSHSFSPTIAGHWFKRHSNCRSQTETFFFLPRAALLSSIVRAPAPPPPLTTTSLFALNITLAQIRPTLQIHPLRQDWPVLHNVPAPYCFRTTHHLHQTFIKPLLNLY